MYMCRMSLHLGLYMPKTFDAIPLLTGYIFRPRYRPRNRNLEKLSPFSYICIQGYVFYIESVRSREGYSNILYPNVVLGILHQKFRGMAVHVVQTLKVYPIKVERQKLLGNIIVR